MSAHALSKEQRVLKIFMSQPLTKRQWEVLEMMAVDPEHEDCLIAYEKGIAYIGLTRIAPRTVTG